MGFRKLSIDGVTNACAVVAVVFGTIAAQPNAPTWCGVLAAIATSLIGWFTGKGLPKGKGL
jgi:ABC-type uncharacterized transport system permease subunit